MPGTARHSSKTWGIQTVYLPREHLGFIEEWLAFHTALGAQYFYLYDNTGSRELSPFANSAEVNGRTRYGLELDFSLTDGEIADIEDEIFARYPVTRVTWQPRVNGEIVYGQVAACDHFSELMRDGWCAFIDIDEFLCSPYEIADLLEGEVLVLLQKKFADRAGHDTALEIDWTFPISTDRWANKLLVDMAHYVKGGESIHMLNARHSHRPVFPAMETLRFNHYNHNPVGHQWLLDNYHQLDLSWRPVPYEAVFTERCRLLQDRAHQIDYDGFVPVPARRSGRRTEVSTAAAPGGGRRITVASADELMAAPQLVTEYCATVGAQPDATLVIVADPADLQGTADRLRTLLVTIGIDPDGGPDMAIVSASELDSAHGRALLANAVALTQTHPPGGPATG